MESIAQRRQYRSKRVKRASPELRPIMIAAWARRARRKGVTFQRFIQAIRPFVKSSPSWYLDAEKLWEAAAPKPELEPLLREETHVLGTTRGMLKDSPVPETATATSKREEARGEISNPSSPCESFMPRLVRRR